METGPGRFESSRRVLVSCGDMVTGKVLEGLDVSKWQGAVKWSELGKAGKVFAFARVSDGLHVVDPCFEANWRGIREAGLIRGAYQFFRASQDPLQQAELLLAHVGKLGAGDLPPALDLELTDGQNATTLITGALAWLRHVEKRLGRKPLVYTGPSIWKELQSPKGFSDYPLWVANYRVSQPHVPEGWARWTFWQHSQSGQLPGIAGPVDLNRFNGSLEELHALAGMSGPAVAPAEPAPASPRVAPRPPSNAHSTSPASTPPSAGDAPPAIPLPAMPTPSSTKTPPVASDPTTAARPSAGEATSPSSLDALLRQRLVSPLPEELQKELALLTDLRDQAASLLGPKAGQQVELALYALLGEKPNLPFAVAVRKSITTRLQDRTHPMQLSALLRTDSPPLQVVLGLGLMLLCTALVGGLAQWKLMHVEWTVFQLPPPLLILTALGGVVGSVASILVRIRDFDEAHDATPATLVLLGFSKPVVGACFALFVLAVLKAQLLPIQVPAAGATESYFFLALSFVCGFSERFAQDLVAKVEGGFLPDDKPDETPVLAPAKSQRE